VSRSTTYTAAEMRYLWRASQLRDRLTDKALAARLGGSRRAISAAIRRMRQKALQGT
jgi:DNA-binding CsgD family transcriptional regulator